MPTNKIEIWERQEDGSAKIVGYEEYETTYVDPIKEKEEQLLQLYAELEALKKLNEENAN
jgi:hypothetical protein